jgi:hypothetical protein
MVVEGCGRNLRPFSIDWDFECNRFAHNSYDEVRCRPKQLPPRFKGGLESFLRVMIARPRSGRNSFTTPNPILPAMEMPKLTAPLPAECWLGGCQKRDRKAPAASPPSWDIESCRVPSSCRARMPLATAYLVRDQSPLLPELNSDCLRAGR